MINPKNRTAALHRAAASFPCLLAILFATGCDQSGGSTVQSRLESAVASGAVSFDFAADPAFSWDRVFVFGCYSSKTQVEAAIGFQWPDFPRTSIESSDSVILVVFVKQNSVIDWFEQSRSIELGWLANGKGYSRTEARFSITRTGGNAELKPLAPLRTPAPPASRPRRRGGAPGRNPRRRGGAPA